MRIFNEKKKLQIMTPCICFDHVAKGKDVGRKGRCASGFETILNTGSQTKGRNEREEKNQENINSDGLKFVASTRM